MSQRTLISFHQKRQKKNKDRISSLLSGGSKKRTSASTPVTAEATASTSTETTRSPFFGGETEMEDILIESVESGDERRTSPTQARKRRRTEKGKEQQYSDGNFSKFSKHLIKIFSNV
jgi:hypothetical protein